MKRYKHQARALLVCFCALALLFSSSLPVLAGVGIQIKQGPTESYENLFYGNAKGTGIGSLLKLQSNDEPVEDEFTISNDGTINLYGNNIDSGGNIDAANFCNASGGSCFSAGDVDTDGDDYIGNSGSHTAGGGLNMNNNIVTNSRMSTQGSLYANNNTYGIHMNNSDIVGLNWLVFQDLGEGIGYLNTDGDIDSGYQATFSYDGDWDLSGGDLNLQGNYIDNFQRLYSDYNNDYIIRDHMNGNVTLSAAGGNLYLGYQNTTGLQFNAPATTALNMNGNNINNVNRIEINNGYIEGNGSGVTIAGDSNDVSAWFYDNEVYIGDGDDPIHLRGSVDQVDSLSFSDGEQILDGTDLRLSSNSGYIDFRPTDGEHGLILREYDGSGTYWGGIRVVNSDRMEFRMDGGSYGGSLVIKDNNNVGIGNTSPSYKLHVSGDIYANGGWLRTSGDYGWYSQTYGGGWHMSDSSWIRSYGNKSIYHNTGTMRTDGTFQVGGSGSTLNVPNGGNFAYRTNTLFANTSGNVGIGTASPQANLHIWQSGQTYGQTGKINFGDGSTRVYIAEETDDYLTIQGINGVTINNMRVQEHLNSETTWNRDTFYSEGSFTTTVSPNDGTGDPSGTARWTRVGDQVTICFPLVYSADSSYRCSATLSGLPSEIQPTNSYIAADVIAYAHSGYRSYSGFPNARAEIARVYFSPGSSNMSLSFYQNVSESSYSCSRSYGIDYQCVSYNLN